MSRLRILFLSQRIPYPPNRGDRILNYNLVRHLAKRHDVTVACLADSAPGESNLAALGRMVKDVVCVPVSTIRSRIRTLLALAGRRRPLTLAHFDEPALRRAVGQLLADRRFDLAIASSSSMASFIEKTDLPRIIHFIDLDSQKWRLYSEISGFPRRQLYHQESQRLLEYERKIAKSFDASLFCAGRELSDFQRLAPGIPARVVRAGVDLDYFQPRPGKSGDRDLIFTGVMDYRPNVDGAQWFCQDVFPLIRAAVPAATFTICGSSPNKVVRRLASLPGVRVTGGVPDVRPYLADAAVAVIPVRIARGIQNKVLEAMAMGLPVVTTTAAFAGLDAELDDGAFVADDQAEFAQHVIGLLQDEPRRRQAGQSARASVEQRFQWDDSFAELDDVISDVMARRAARSQPAAICPLS